MLAPGLFLDVNICHPETPSIPGDTKLHHCVLEAETPESFGLPSQEVSGTPATLTPATMQEGLADFSTSCHYGVHEYHDRDVCIQYP